MMASFLITLMVCVLSFGNCHHCSSTTELWNDIQSVLDYTGHNHTDPRHLIIMVLKHQHSVDMYNALVKKRCKDRELPRFKTLEKFISKDALVEQFISNVTSGSSRTMTLHNYDQISTLALSLVIHLERYVCENAKDADHIFSLLGSKRKELDIDHLVNVLVRHYNPADITDDRESLIAHNNRLQCLNVEMIEDFLHLTYKPEHHHQKNRIIGGRDHFKLGQNGDNYFLGDIIFNIPPKINNHNGNNHKHHHVEDKTKKGHDHQHHHANDKAQNGPTTPRHDHHSRPPSVHHNKLTVNSKFKQKLRIVSSLIVSAMLKGVKIYPGKRSCTIDHLDYIMKHYGVNRSFLNVTGVENLMKDILNQSTKARVKSHTPNEKRYGKGHIHSNDKRSHDSNCRKTPAVNTMFVDTDSTKFNINFTELLTFKDILHLSSHSVKHLNKAQFLDVCPSIIYSLIQRSKIKPPPKAPVTEKIRPSSLETYGAGTASVFIISLCSLIGAVFVKFTREIVKQYAMGMLLSLSVGCLVGDAVLHLIPEILIKDNEEENKPRIPETLTKQCALLASIYSFFLLELTLSLLSKHDRNEERCSTTNHEIENECESTVDKNNKSLAWMIVIGDAIHNFADGLAIGAAFSKDLTVGMSTSIAVFCHELPHELGDFAALISTGMSMRKAMILNFISSLTAFAGLYIGIVASSNDVARSWIFAAGAGMFIYVSLSNLVPEVQSYLRKFPNLCMFLSLNVGLLLGYVSMLLLAIYEHDIKIT